MIREYYRLTKPGIVYGNVFTVLAGFFFASKLVFTPVLLMASVLGMALVIAGSCVFNNVLDRGIDGRMDRTKNRAVVTGLVSVPKALIYGTVLLVPGVVVLALHVNTLTAGVALFGAVFYVVVYGYAKRSSHLGTVVGSVAGAVPILAGYTSYAQTIDVTGLVLFLILVLWQMPHFYAIAVFRLKDYSDAGIPVLPAVIGIRKTKIAIIAYIGVFLYAEAVLFLMGAVGYTYLAVSLGFGIAWFVRALRGLRDGDDVRWAKGIFLFSIQVLVAFSLAISFGTLFR